MVLGLTGGIGSGKSVVSKIMEVLGCAIFNSDQAAREIYYDPMVRTKVINLLGVESYLNETLIDKKYIGGKIFSNEELLRGLNQIIHPAVSDKFKDFIMANPSRIIVRESALLFEANISGQVDKIITVVADDEIRITRVMARDGMSRQEVQTRMNSQLPQDEKIKRSDYVIFNNGTEFLVPGILDILKKLKHA